MLVNPFGSFGAGGGGGPGVAGGRPTAPVRNGGTMGTLNFSGAQTYHMGTNFAAGNDVFVCTNHWNSSIIAISSVVVNGVTATLLQTGEGSVALLQFWVARNVPGTADTIVVTPASGSGHYITLNVIEIAPTETTSTMEVVAQNHAVSTAPGSTVTTAATTQCDDMIYAAWRDDNGVNNVAGTPVPAGWTTGYLERDGVNTQGGASAFKFVQRLGTQNISFACTSTNWYETIMAIKWKLPVTFVGAIKQDWAADTAWVSSPVAVTTASGDVLVTVGGWWDDTFPRPSDLPTDSAGTFVAAHNPTISGGEVPVGTQVCYEATPSVGAHSVTPPSIGTDGDGWFAVLKIPGRNTTTPIRDTGTIRSYHTPVTPPDGATIQSLTVSTSGSSADIGDIALLTVVCDPNSITNSDVAFVPPAGWFVILNKFNMTDNIGVLICVAKVTTAGQISATTTWTDNATYVAEASIVIFAHA